MRSLQNPPPGYYRNYAFTVAVALLSGVFALKAGSVFLSLCVLAVLIFSVVQVTLVWRRSRKRVSQKGEEE